MSRKKLKEPQLPKDYVGPLDVTLLGAPSVAQVNLLPAEVREQRALGGVRIRALLIVALAVIVVGAAFVISSLSLAAAEAERLEEEARVQALQTEIAQYAEVPLVQGQLAAVRNARAFAMSRELPWADYLRAIEAVAPDDWTLTDFSATIPTPMEDFAMNPNPIGVPSVATITFTGRALALPDVAAWIEGMSEIPGIADPYFSSTTVSEEDGTVFYETTATAQLTVDALRNRFTEEDDDA